MGKLDWQGARRRSKPALKKTDEADRLDRDAAARWLAKNDKLLNVKRTKGPAKWR
jgi:hypothetical protein